MQDKDASIEETVQYLLLALELKLKDIFQTRFCQLGKSPKGLFAPIWEN